MSALLSLVDPSLCFGWMRFVGKVHSRLLREQALAILDGGAPRPTRNPKLRRLCEAAAAWVHGRWTDVEAPSGPPDDETDAWLHFFHAFALRRLQSGRVAAWERMAAVARQSGCPSLQLEVAMENVRTAIFMGRYPVAVAAIEEILGETSSATLAIHTYFSCSLFLGICHQASGRFRAAEASLSDLRNLVKMLPADRMYVQFLRRKASLLGESERVQAAERFFRLHEDTLTASASSLQRVLHLRERLRLSIIRDDSETVVRLLNDIEDEVERSGISREIFNIDEERCEVELRMRGSGRGLVRLFEERLRENKGSGNDAATCLMHFLLARVLLRDGAVEKALAQALEARRIAERWKYGRTRVRILLLLSEIHARNHERTAAIAAARAALVLTKRMPLPVQGACAGFLVSLFEGGNPSFADLFSLYSVTHSLTEIRYHLECCGLPLHLGARVTTIDGVVTEEAAFPLVERLLESEAIVFLSKEEKLLSLSEGRVRSVSLTSEVGAVMRLLWDKGQRGASLEDLHALRFPHVAYDPVRHRSRTAMFFMRARRFLQPLGLDALHGGETAGYVLQASALLIRVEPLDHEVVEAHLTPRQEQIVSLLGSGMRLSGRRLCQELGITRQTLHRMLKRLVEAGVVEGLGAGKSRRYRLRTVC